MSRASSPSHPWGPAAGLPAALVLARQRFWWTTLVSGWTRIAQVVGGIVVLIPLYLILRDLHLVNTLLGVSLAEAIQHTLAAGDPASTPDGRLPALVGPRPAVGAPFVRVAVVLDVLALTVVACAGLIVRRRSGLRLRRRLLPSD